MSKPLRSGCSFSNTVRRARLKTLLSGVGRVNDAVPLSSEDTANLIQLHLRCKGASRLPVLIVEAFFEAAKVKRGERILNMTTQNAADLQFTVFGDEKVVTRCEMKNRVVLRRDIDHALQRVAVQDLSIQAYIFITTKGAGDEVREYAASMYDETGGAEIAFLDCIGFLRRFLPLSRRLRKDFLDRYQELVLRESDSAVSQALKEAFLALRQAAESAD